MQCGCHLPLGYKSIWQIMTDLTLLHCCCYYYFHTVKRHLTSKYYYFRPKSNLHNVCRCCNSSTQVHKFIYDACCSISCEHNGEGVPCPETHLVNYMGSDSHMLKLRTSQDEDGADYYAWVLQIIFQTVFSFPEKQTDIS